MRLKLVVVSAFFALVACAPDGASITSVQASESSLSLSDFLSPFRSTLTSLESFFRGQAEQDSASGDGDSLREQTYKMFMKIYNKTYSTPDELRRRMSIFLKRRQDIAQSIREYEEGRATFTMRENPFVDLDDSELKALAGVAAPKTIQELLPVERRTLIAERERRLERRRRSVGLDENEVNLTDSSWYELDEGEGDYDESGLYVMAAGQLPASKDWRQSGCIATPMHQRECGCCYAISTMNTIEAMRCINRKSSGLLSPQHIVDCATPRAGYANKGCNGGWPTLVLEYLRETKVAVREVCYPFVRRQGFCKLNQKRQMPGCTLNASPTDTQLTYKVLHNENDILYHVANTGPVITVMKASQKFIFYSSGIFDDPSCPRDRKRVDHAIVIVGYGTENGVDYWLIKNSWGTREWGEMGYGKYRRGRNVCLIGHWGWVILS